MNTTDKLSKALKGFEGLELQAYLCPSGVPTIGYGHTRGVKMGMTVTRAQANALLAEDIEEAERRVARYVTVEMTPGQWDAITDFAFNVKERDFAASTLVKYINAKRPASDIQQQFRRWVYGTGSSGNKIRLLGLVTRREWEAQRWAEED